MILNDESELEQVVNNNWKQQKLDGIVSLRVCMNEPKLQCVYSRSNRKLTVAINI